MTSEPGGRAERRAPAPEPRLLAHIRGAIRRGYQPDTTWTVDADYFVGPASEAVSAHRAAAALAGLAGTGVAIVLPTRVGGSDLASQVAAVRELLDRAGEVAASAPEIATVVFVGMQWLHPDEREEAWHRLRALAALAAGGPAIRFVGIALPGPGKSRTLNAAIRVAERAGLAAVGWVDDDVRMEPHCLARMVAAFRTGGSRGAVGATKVPHATRHATSRLLFRAKALTQTATSYPHGCCILVATEVVHGGIPDRYASDDGYVCFRLLAPELDNPLADLRLVEGARCHYTVAGPAGPTVRRIRRLLLNHHIFLADWPYPVARCYFRMVLFDGMWPLTNWDASAGPAAAAAKAGIKWLYLTWFGRVGLELYLRGLLGRPLRRVSWAGYPAPPAPRKVTAA